MRFAITVCATKRYSYALTAQARRVAACVRDMTDGVIILVGDKSKELQKALKVYEEILPKGWTAELIQLDGLNDEHKNYKEDAQLTIAQLRTAAFTRARFHNVEFCWSLDSDVLPPENALSCSLQMLSFDQGFYSIAACPYPSQGGGGFLCGRGTIYHQIAPDYTEEERIIPEDLQKQLDQTREALKVCHSERSEESPGKIEKLQKELQSLDEKVRGCPAKGNVFELNAKRWRPRGWFDNAYPAIGRGSIVPSDWAGFGCTLMNRRALASAHFDGYEGKGTEDLYIIWNRWYQNGLKIAAIPHCPCDHIIRNLGKEGYYIHQQAYHETEGECVGHLRYRSRPFYSMDAGEKYDAANDGKMACPPKPCAKEDAAKPEAVPTP